MIRLTLTREPSTEEGTFGVLEGEALEMQTVELPWKDNARNISCIPVGVYLCTPHVSPTHGRCFWLQDVTARSEILIHAGNWAGDTGKGWKSDLLGCIAIGFGSLRGDGQDMILNSQKALGKLIEYTEYKAFVLDIREV